METMEKLFHLKENRTNIKTELLAGLTTFVSMSYILFVNPTVLGVSGMDKGAVFAATALASALTSLIMGLVANYPIASAPGLGINAFFSYTVVLGMGVSWENALAGVFVAGIIFALITVFRWREKIINAIPSDLKFAISAGIGIFIAFIGLVNGGLIVANDSTIVGLGSLTVPTTWLTIFGLIVTIILMIRRTPGAIFIGMFLSSVVGMLTGLIKVPTAILAPAPSLAPTFGQALTHIQNINSLEMVVVVLTFLLVTFFDTAGTLVGLAQQAGFMKDNKMPRVGRALAADSTGMIAGALLGTSPVSAYVESSAGIAIGGRTGLTAVTTGILFIVSLLFSPLLAVITPQVTAPALIIVGVLIAEALAEVNWKDLTVAIPAFVIVIGMPLTYSISDGLALGMILYPITMLAAGKGKEISKMMWALAFIFVLFFIILNTNLK